MTCEPSKTPSADSIDIAAIRARYYAERDKRIQTVAADQYVHIGHHEDKFSEIYEGDPYIPVIPRDPITSEIDVAVMGGGWTGILAGYHLMNAGVTDFRIIDHAGDFGGVWYWNRYPGLQCDNDAYCYLPLLEETGFMPSKKFADGSEIRAYAQSIPKRFGYADKGLFHTLVTSLRWDENINRWRIGSDRGDDILARFVVMAGGLLNIPKLPGIAGIGAFKGKIFHTARWDYEYTGGSQAGPTLEKLADKRVAIIGTGATSVQAVPFLGKAAKELYVVQRTPSTVDKRFNAATDPAWVSSLQPGWQAERQANFHRAAMEFFKPGEADMICDIWTELSRNLEAELAAEGHPQLPIEEVMKRREVIDYQLMERLRNRIDELVDDRETAEKLKPWYRYLCKRPASNDDYYPTFNRPNVHLVDVSGTRGVERMTEKGFVANGVEHEVDCIIFASGFEVASDLDKRWGIDTIEGRDGVSLYKHWQDGFKSLHGMSTHGFPNMFFTGYVQSGLNSSTTEQTSKHDYHVAYMISEALARHAEVVEPSREAEDAWVRHIRATAVDIWTFQNECTPSYFNGERSEKQRFYAGEPYGPGWDAFMKVLSDWRATGELEGLVLTQAQTEPAE